MANRRTRTLACLALALLLAAVFGRRAIVSLGSGAINALNAIDSSLDAVFSSFSDNGTPEETQLLYSAAKESFAASLKTLSAASQIRYTRTVYVNGEPSSPGGMSETVTESSLGYTVEYAKKNGESLYLRFHALDADYLANISEKTYNAIDYADERLLYLADSGERGILSFAQAYAGSEPLLSFDVLERGNIVSWLTDDSGTLRARAFVSGGDKYYIEYEALMVNGETPPGFSFEGFEEDRELTMDVWDDYVNYRQGTGGTDDNE